MKILLPAALLASALFTSAALAADSSDRTSMPSSCSDRDANCVIKDGPPRRRGAPPPEEKKDNRGNTPVGTDRSGAGPNSGAIVDPSGATRR